jgi:hypothetical protein
MDISDLSTEALKEQLRRREAARRQRSVSVPTDIEENSADDSLYMTPRGVSFRSKKRHRSQSPDLLDGNANAGTARRNAPDVKSRTHQEDIRARRTELVTT